MHGYVRPCTNVVNVVTTISFEVSCLQFKIHNSIQLQCGKHTAQDKFKLLSFSPSDFRR